MEFIFKETIIPEQLKIKMRTESRYALDPDYAEPIYEITFTTFSKFLNFMKSKENGSAAIICNDYKGNMVFASIVRYFPNEEQPDMPGNWNLSYTLNPEDIKDVVSKHYTIDVAYTKMYNDIAVDLKNFQLSDVRFIIDVTRVCIELIKEFLDKNAKEDEEVELLLPGIFRARVQVEDGEKIMSIEPDTTTKQLIKDDLAIEK